MYFGYKGNVFFTLKDLIIYFDIPFEKGRAKNIRAIREIYVICVYRGISK